MSKQNEKITVGKIQNCRFWGWDYGVAGEILCMLHLEVVGGCISLFTKDVIGDMVTSVKHGASLI